MRECRLQIAFRVAIIAATLSVPGATLGDTVAAPSHAPDPPVAPELSPDSQTDVWLVSTRHLTQSCLYQDAPVPLDVRRFDGAGCWHASRLGSLLESTEPDTITLIYVHGNRFEWHDAIEHGWLVHSAVAARAGVPVRLIVWSWPSDRIRGPLRDVRVKAFRADSESYFLGWFLSQLAPEARTSLFGSSFGTRVISGALHLLAGGDVYGQRLLGAIHRKPSRVVLTAAASHNDWLLPGRFHGQAAYQTDAMLLLYNSCDSTLKKYHVMDRHTHSRALGYTGLARCRGHEVWQDLLAERNVCCVIGSSHSERDYYESETLMSHARRYLLWEPVE